MKILLFTLVLTFCSFCARSQSFLNYTKEKVSRRIYLNKKIKFQIIDTDSTLTFQTNDPNYTKTAKVFHFNKQGKCDSEAILMDCEECYRLELKKIIKNAQWVEADSTHYLTQHGKKLQITTHYQGQPFAFIVKWIE